jgi:hypothetical protein
LEKQRKAPLPYNSIYCFGIDFYSFCLFIRMTTRMGNEEWREMIFYRKKSVQHTTTKTRSVALSTKIRFSPSSHFTEWSISSCNTYLYLNRRCSRRKHNQRGLFRSKQLNCFVFEKRKRKRIENGYWKGNFASDMKTVVRHQPSLWCCKTTPFVISQLPNSSVLPTSLTLVELVNKCFSWSWKRIQTPSIKMSQIFSVRLGYA